MSINMEIEGVFSKIVATTQWIAQSAGADCISADELDFPLRVSWLWP